MGIDLTSTDVKVQPPDPEASALAPSPVLLVATSDGALRLFTFAHMSKPTEGLVAPALPFSDALPPMAPDEQVLISFNQHYTTVLEAQSLQNNLSSEERLEHYLVIGIRLADLPG